MSTLTWGNHTNLRPVHKVLTSCLCLILAWSFWYIAQFYQCYCSSKTLSDTFPISQSASTLNCRLIFLAQVLIIHGLKYSAGQHFFVMHIDQSFMACSMLNCYRCCRGIHVEVCGRHKSQELDLLKTWSHGCQKRQLWNKKLIMGHWVLRAALPYGLWH